MDFVNIIISLFFVILSPKVALSEYYNEYECNQPLLDKAVLSATSSLPDRGPQYARLYGGYAWSAEVTDFGQNLIIDLGEVRNITRIATQGRPHSQEYVMEYSISYGTNALDYADYKEHSGNVMMFRGNVDGESIHRNEFEVPIIAQWVRINPTRWRDRISLRVELYGCEYDATDMHFNGSSYLKVDLMRDPIAALRESIRLRFKTIAANGVILYSKGTQGDYVALQLRDNKMVLNIDLGSGTTTSLCVGSLLDDNIWHEVVISRNRRDILFSVDRVFVRDKIKGDFNTLNLNQAFYVGGVPNIQEGMAVSQNYTGCIQNIYLNSTNLFREAKGIGSYGDTYKYEQINTMYNCLEPDVIPVTFLDSESHARLAGYKGLKSINASFAFRTYDNNGIMFFHAFSSSGHVVIFLEDGKAKVELMTDSTPKVVLDNFEEKFNDGRWHLVVLTVSKNSLVFSIDYSPRTTTRLLSILSGETYFFGGGVKMSLGYTLNNMGGFRGCMRSISLDGNVIHPTDWKESQYCCPNSIVFDSCQVTDLCNPNPCKHGGLCKQTWKKFECDCRGTGYGGAVCHSSINPLSCQAYKNVQAVSPRNDIKIDVDGSGPLPPFPVTCEFYADGRVATVLHHNNQGMTTVDGFQDPGSFMQDIHYDADDDQISALINRSNTCKQMMKYSCRASKLMNSPSDEFNYRPFGWWVSRHNQKMDYWAGALPGSRKCECGVLGTCYDRTKWCNCDADVDRWLHDGGEILEKENLPVKQLRFGDTGNALDEKEGRYTLGPLMCEGDDLFNNVITFRLSDATIRLPTFDMGHSGDIYFEFRTAVENAVIFHSKGPTDYIKLSIVGGNQLQFQYEAGSGPMAVVREVSYKLSDDQWHSVSVERNRKAASLVIDGSLKAEVSEPIGPVRALHLNSDLVFGASLDLTDGFTGCIRALLVNGNHVDLRSYARQHLYGIGEGCVGKCQSSPCLNNGTCHERYDGYMCDCRWTAFKGPICADEIGVNMKGASMIKYTFEGSFRSTIAEHIRVGFTTTNPRGFLLGLTSHISKEYMTVVISNSGSLRIVFDFGFERQEVIYPNKHFGLGQYHNLLIQRKNRGATLVITVDNYQPVEFNFDIKESADAQFNNVQYLYIGKNETMSEGFIGCVSRVEFDDIYPLKLLFQQKGPENVKIVGPTLPEDYCGVEPITHPPDIVETRPPVIFDENKLRAYNQKDSAILGSILAIVFLALVILAIIIGRYLHRHKGEYLTQEDAGAETAMDPDTAVVHGTTGHHVQKKKEWFI